MPEQVLLAIPLDFSWDWCIVKVYKPLMTCTLYCSVLLPDTIDYNLNVQETYQFGNTRPRLNCIQVPIIDDRLIEDNETVTVLLRESNTNSANITTPIATITIIDDDCKYIFVMTLTCFLNLITLLHRLIFSCHGSDGTK